MFKLPSGLDKWFTATIEELEYVSGSGQSLVAHAVVMYDAAHGYEAEKSTLVLRGNRTVQTKQLTTYDATWKFPGDDVDTRTQDEDDDGDGAGQWAVVGQSQDQGKKRKTEYPGRKHDRSRTPPAKFDIDEIMERVEPMVQLKIAMSKYNCLHNQEIETRVRATRVTWMDEVLRNLASLPRPTSDTSAYAESLTGGSTTHKFKVDYGMFKYMRDDAMKYRSGKSIAHPMVGRTQCLPRASDLDACPASLQTHVIFNTASAFFDWLGISPDMKRTAILIDDRDQGGPGGVQAMRIMGSLDRVNSDIVDTIRMYVGRSAPTQEARDAYEKFHYGSGGPRLPDATTVEYIAYACEDWDVENNKFVEPPCTCKEKLGRGPYGADRVGQTFSMSWDAIPPLSRAKYGVTPHFSQGVQLGYVTLRYPYILARGRATCTQLRAALRTFDLDAVIGGS